MLPITATSRIEGRGGGSSSTGTERRGVGDRWCQHDGAEGITETSASLLVTSALLVVTMFARNKKLFVIRIKLGMFKRCGATVGNQGYFVHVFSRNRTQANEC